MKTNVKKMFTLDNILKVIFSPLIIFMLLMDSIGIEDEEDDREEY